MAWLASDSNDDDRLYKNLIRFITHLAGGDFEVISLQGLEPDTPDDIEIPDEMRYDSMTLDSVGTLKETESHGG